MYKYIPIKVGDEGPAVLAYGQRLVELGYDKYYDPRDKKSYTFAPSTYYGSILCAMVENLLAKLIDVISVEWVMSKFPGADPDWFKVDGSRVSPALGMYLEHAEELGAYYGQYVKLEFSEPPAASLIKGKTELADEVIRIARREIGVREKGTSNTGVRVNEYQEVGSCGDFKNGGNPWCSFFVKWCYRMAFKTLDLEDKLECQGYTPYDRAWGIKNGIAIKHPEMDQIIIGSAFLIYGSSRGDAIHTGLIAGKKGNSIITIEGNTNSAGSADGGGVEQRLRPIQQMWYQIAVPELWK